MKKSELRQMIREEYKHVLLESDLEKPMKKLEQQIVKKIDAAMGDGTLSDKEGEKLLKDTTTAFDRLRKIYWSTYKD